MKSFIALLCFTQIIFINVSLSQSNSVNQAADACPSWSKKQAKTSTDYAYLSKRSAADNSNDFSKPKYQSIYAKNTSTKNELKRGKTAASQAHRVATPAKTEKRELPAPEEKNESSKATRQPNSEKEPLAKEEKKTEDETADIKETETLVEKIKPDTAAPATKTKAESKEAGKSKEKTAAALKKEKKEEAAKKSKQKQQRKNLVNKLKVGKKNATDCPDF